MSDYLVKNVRMGISAAPETVFNYTNGWYAVDSVNTGADTVQLPGHTFSDDTPIKTLGNAAGGLANGTTYYAKTVSGGISFHTAAPAGPGNIVDLSADNGPFYVYAASGADTFHRFVTSAKNFYIPNAEKFDDRGKIGLGTDLPNVRETGYLNPVSMDITDALDTHVHAILMKRACGSAVVDANPSGSEYTHTFQVEPTVVQLPSSSMVWGVGGADYYWYGMTVDSFQVEGSRSDQPTFTATLMGTGKHGKVLHLGSSVLNSYVVPKYAKGAETRVLYTNGGTQYLADRTTGTQRILSWNVSLTNNNITDDKRPGDKRIATLNPLSGHYVDRMLSGDREVSGEVTITVDTNMQEVADSLSDSIYQNFIIDTAGAFITPGTPALQYGTKFTFPKTYVSTEEATDDNGLAAIRMTLFPVFDSGTGTSLQVQVRNNIATLI